LYKIKNYETIYQKLYIEKRREECYATRKIHAIAEKWFGRHLDIPSHYPGNGLPLDIQGENGVAEMANQKEEMEYFQAPDITVRITDRCNFHCIHCFVDSGSRVCENELSTEELKSIIDWAADNGSFRLGITGGEPTLRKDLLEIITYAKSKNLWTMVTTNGYALSREFCKKLGDTQIDQVDVSLDHAAADHHDQFRGQPGAYDCAIRTIKMLTQYEVPTAITSVISSWNFDSFQQLYALAHESTVTMFKADAFIAIGRGEMGLALTPLQFKWLYDWFIQNCDSHMLHDTFSDKFDFLYDQERYCANILDAILGYRGMPICEAGITRCTITAQGTVLPCSYFSTPEFYAGNVRTSSLDEIWHNSEVMNTMRKRTDFEGICTSCEYNTLCRGGCRARAHFMGKTRYGPDPYCWIAYRKRSEECV
jgi:radical SAM protein with 4Fe4S-binding SPASM domain